MFCFNAAVMDLLEDWMYEALVYMFVLPMGRMGLILGGTLLYLGRLKGPPDAQRLGLIQEASGRVGSDCPSGASERDLDENHGKLTCLHSLEEAGILFYVEWEPNHLVIQDPCQPRHRVL